MGKGKNEETPKEYFNGFPLNQKKRKRKTSIPYKLRLYLYRKFKDKNTGGPKGISIEKVRVAANKKFKKVLTKTLSSSSISRFLKKKFKRLYTLVTEKKSLLSLSILPKVIILENLSPGGDLFSNKFHLGVINFLKK